MAASMGERIAVLVSGNGTNLQALLDDPFCGPRISLWCWPTGSASARSTAPRRAMSRRS